MTHKMSRFLPCTLHWGQTITSGHRYLWRACGPITLITNDTGKTGARCHDGKWQILFEK